MKKYTLILLCISSLSSCLYSAIYNAEYSLYSPDKVTADKEICQALIFELCKDNRLFQSDQMFGSTDTLRFFGEPYHSFMFVFSEHNDSLKLNVVYYGNIGSLRNPPYETFFDSLKVSLESEFEITLSIREFENNSRRKKRTNE